MLQNQFRRWEKYSEPSIGLREGGMATDEADEAQFEYYSNLMAFGDYNYHNRPPPQPIVFHCWRGP